MGGYDVIAVIIHKMLALLKADARFARFGLGRSADSHRRTWQLIVDQLCNLCGGSAITLTRHEGFALRAGNYRSRADNEHRTNSSGAQKHDVPIRETTRRLRFSLRAMTATSIASAYRRRGKHLRARESNAEIQGPDKIFHATPLSQ
jgi:hypothetical protein